MSPLVDLWKRVWTHADRVGRKHVTIRWVPSHQKWQIGETWAQRMDRRGNDQADLMAAKGRSQHEIDERLKERLKVIEHTVSIYHK